MSLDKLVEHVINEDLDSFIEGFKKELHERLEKKEKEIKTKILHENNEINDSTYEELLEESDLEDLEDDDDAEEVEKKDEPIAESRNSINVEKDRLGNIIMKYRGKDVFIPGGETGSIDQAFKDTFGYELDPNDFDEIKPKGKTEFLFSFLDNYFD
jgi:hypothetical protein